MALLHLSRSKAFHCHKIQPCLGDCWMCILAEYLALQSKHGFNARCETSEVYLGECAAFHEYTLVERWLVSSAHFLCLMRYWPQHEDDTIGHHMAVAWV